MRRALQLPRPAPRNRWYNDTGAPQMTDNTPPAPRGFDPMSPRRAVLSLPQHLERIVDARWEVWTPWVRMFVLRRREPDPDAASKDLRNRHREHLLALRRAGVTMRTICRNRLDDPRLNAEVRGILVDAARERQSKARFRRSEEQRKQDRQRMLIQLSPFVGNAATSAPTNDSTEERSPAATMVFDPLSVQGAIQSIRQHVCEHFYLREMRDPELTRRTHRRAYVLPRQIAMYIVRHLTMATLAEIGGQFGGRHHTTVLHAINKIEDLRRLDKDLDCTITRLMDACRGGDYFAGAFFA